MSAVFLGRYNHEAGKPGPSPRTYRELIAMGRSSPGGTCCSCHRWCSQMPEGKRLLFSLGTRANICQECCERKGDEILGPVLRAERKARSYAKDLVKRQVEDADLAPAFWARLAGVSTEFFLAVYKNAKETAR